MNVIDVSDHGKPGYTRCDATDIHCRVVNIIRVLLITCVLALALICLVVMRHTAYPVQVNRGWDVDTLRSHERKEIPDGTRVCHKGATYPCPDWEDDDDMHNSYGPFPIRLSLTPILKVKAIFSDQIMYDHGGLEKEQTVVRTTVYTKASMLSTRGEYGTELDRDPDEVTCVVSAGVGAHSSGSPPIISRCDRVEMALFRKVPNPKERPELNNLDNDEVKYHYSFSDLDDLQQQIGMPALLQYTWDSIAHSSQFRAKSAHFCYHARMMLFVIALVFCAVSLALVVVAVFKGGLHALSFPTWYIAFALLPLLALYNYPDISWGVNLSSFGWYHLVFGAIFPPLFICSLLYFWMCVLSGKDGQTDVPTTTKMTKGRRRRDNPLYDVESDGDSSSSDDDDDDYDDGDGGGGGAGGGGDASLEAVSLLSERSDDNDNDNDGARESSPPDDDDDDDVWTSTTLPALEFSLVVLLFQAAFLMMRDYSTDLSDPMLKSMHVLPSPISVASIHEWAAQYHTRTFFLLALVTLCVVWRALCIVQTALVSGYHIVSPYFAKAFGFELRPRSSPSPSPSSPSSPTTDQSSSGSLESISVRQLFVAVLALFVVGIILVATIAGPDHPYSYTPFALDESPLAFVIIILLLNAVVLSYAIAYAPVGWWETGSDLVVYGGTAGMGVRRLARAGGTMKR